MNLKKYIINGIEYNVSVNSVTDDKAEVTVNGVTYQVDIVNSRDLLPAQDSITESVEEKVQVELPAQVSQSDSSCAKAVKSPLPGVVLGIKVKVGEHVKVGQTVAVLEAMKMENEIQSEYDGIVRTVNVSEGDSVLEGAAMITIG